MALLNEYIKNLSNAEQERLRYLLNDLRHCERKGEKFRFLDMGCGSGTMSAGVLLSMPEAEGTLIDIQDRFMVPPDIAQSVVHRYRFVAWKDISDIRENQYDLVISTDVLEHIPDWQQTFRDLCRYVGNAGYLYVQTPSHYPSPNYPLARIVKQRILCHFGLNDPQQHVRHGLSCKQIFDEGARMGLKPLVAAEDFVVDGMVYCGFKPRVHCLFQKP